MGFSLTNQSKNLKSFILVLKAHFSKKSGLTFHDGLCTMVENTKNEKVARVVYLQIIYQPKNHAYSYCSKDAFSQKDAFTLQE